MGMRQLVYRAYERRVAAPPLPPAGPRAGGILDFLGWCEDAGVERVTLWLLSTDNLGRPPQELADLLEIIEDVVGRPPPPRRWRVHPVGALDLLPAATARRLKEHEDSTRGVEGLHVNVAI